MFISRKCIRRDDDVVTSEFFSAVSRNRVRTVCCQSLDGSLFRERSASSMLVLSGDGFMREIS